MKEQKLFFIQNVNINMEFVHISAKKTKKCFLVE